MKTFTLEDQEAAFIVRVVGQLPTESGAFPLLQKLQQQFSIIEEEQLNELNKQDSVVAPWLPQVFTPN